MEFWRTSRNLQKQRSKETVCVLRGLWTRDAEETDSDTWNFEEKKKDEMRDFRKRYKVSQDDKTGELTTCVNSPGGQPKVA